MMLVTLPMKFYSTFKLFFNYSQNKQKHSNKSCNREIRNENENLTGRNMLEIILKKQIELEAKIDKSLMELEEKIKKGLTSVLTEVIALKSIHEKGHNNVSDTTLNDFPLHTKEDFNLMENDLGNDAEYKKKIGKYIFINKKIKCIYYIF